MHHRKGHAALLYDEQALLLPGQHLGNIGRGLANRFCRQGFARVALLGDEYLAISFQPIAACGFVAGQPVGDQLAARDVGLGALGERRRGVDELRALEGALGAGRHDQVGVAFAFPDAQHAGYRGIRIIAKYTSKSVARIFQFAHQLEKTILADLRRDGGQRGGERLILALAGMAQQAVLRLVEQFARRAFIGDGKMRRDAGLKWKAPQQRLAKSVNGEDFHAARGIEHFGEQHAGAAEFGVLGGALEQFAQGHIQYFIGRGGPLAERAGDADGHLRRRRAGKGQA